MVDEGLSEQSDASLVVAIARWQGEALAEAYRRHGRSVYAGAARVLGDRSRAEDVTQAVFASLWDNAERFDPDRGSLRAFLLSMAHGRAVDMMRSEGSRRAREDRIAALAEAPYDLEHEVWDLAVASQVREALERLSESERRAIEMAYFGGYTYREVAGLMRVPEGTAKSWIRTGLARLRVALAEAGLGSS